MISDDIKAFVKLGEFLQDDSSDVFKTIVDEANHSNGWFTPENIKNALQALSKNLTEKKLNHWLKKYKSSIEQKKSSYTVGVIMAGNLPLVGFHDFLSVLLSGNKFLGKLSSQDNKLLPALSKILIEFEPSFSERIIFEESFLKNFDAIIATGSTNSSRYFEYYFSKYPHIIRKSRNSVAVLTGNETPNDLKELGKDIFQYFGLGCRNVSKIFVPEGYDLTQLLDAFKSYKEIEYHYKYYNNYEYNKAVYLINNIKHLDNGFLLLKEQNEIASPVGVVYYEQYNKIEDAIQSIELHKENIQCVVTDKKIFKHAVPFGCSQSPELHDYADGIDTMEFLLNI